jgi:hypothetical protein
MERIPEIIKLNQFQSVVKIKDKVRRRRIISLEFALYPYLLARHTRFVHLVGIPLFAVCSLKFSCSGK